MRNRFIVLVGLVVTFILATGLKPAQASASFPTFFITAYGEGSSQGTSYFDNFDHLVTGSTGTWIDAGPQTEYEYATSTAGGSIYFDGTVQGWTTDLTPGIHGYNGPRQGDGSFGMLAGPDANGNPVGMAIGIHAANKTGSDATVLRTKYVCERWVGNGTDTAIMHGYYVVGTGLTLASAMASGNAVEIPAFACNSNATINGPSPDGNAGQYFTPLQEIPVKVPNNSEVFIYFTLAAPPTGKVGFSLDDMFIYLGNDTMSDAVTVTANPTSQTYGDTATFIASVTGSASGTTAHTNPLDGGTMAFSIDNGASSNGTLQSDGTWHYSPSALDVGASHSITATWTPASGDSLPGPTSGTLGNYSVSAQTPGLTLAVTPSQDSTYGNSMTYTATVTKTGNGSTPTGSFGYTVDNGCTSATCTTTGTPVGTNTQFVTFTSSSSNYNDNTASHSATVTNKAGSKLVVTSSNASPGYGDDVTFTVTLSNNTHPGGGLPPLGAGSVQLTAGGTAIAGKTGTPVAQGQAQFGGNSLVIIHATAGVDFPLGSSTVSATYAGDANYLASSNAASSVTSQTESTTETTTVTVAQTSSSTYSNDATFKASVTSQSGDVVKDGSVTFTITGPSPATTAVTQSGNVDTTGMASITVTGSTFAAGSYAVTAAYASPGSVHDSSSTSTSFAHARAAATTTLTVTAPTPSQFGNAVTFTATPTTTTAGTPPDCAANCVQLFEGTTSLGNAKITNGTATFSVSGLALGDHVVHAVYTSPTGNYSNATSANFTEHVDKAVSVVTPTVTTPINNVVYGTTDSFNVAVTSNAGSGVPTGTITVATSGPNSQAGQKTLHLDATGQATFDTTIFPQSLLLAGPNTITVSYSGDVDHTAATGTVTFTIAKATTTLGLTTSPNPSAAGASVTLSTHFTIPFGGTPTGTITFFDGTSSLGSVTPDQIDSSIVVSNLSTGSHSITAQYSGDANFTGSTSTATVQVVNPATTTTAVLPSANPVLPNTPITFGVAVTSSAAPTGSVQLAIDGLNVTTIQLSGGAGLYKSSGLSLGSHVVTATYSGDSSNLASSGTVTVNVDASATSFALTATPQTPLFGESVTLDVALTSPAGVPTGSVTLTDSGNPVGTVQLVNGAASFALPNLSVGTHALTVTYPGDGPRLAGTGSTVVVVKVRPTSTTLTQSSAQSAPGQAVVFTAAVSSDLGPVTGGTVAFTSDGVQLGTSPLSSGSAQLTTSALTTGTHVIIAVFQGSASFQTSQSFQLEHDVVTSPQADAGATTTPTPDAGPGAQGSSGGPSVGNPGVTGGSSSGTNITAGGGSDDSSCSSTGQPLSFGGGLLAAIVALFVTRRRRRR